MRRLLVLTAAVFVAEAALFSAITPLLAHYAREGSVSKVSAGLLAATYAMGLIPGSLLASRLSGRIGVRAVTIVGVAAFAATTAAFGIAGRIGTLDLFRAGQGLAAGCMWGGSLAWLIGAAPLKQRGEYLGAAFGISIVGTLLGPLIGIVAVTVGTELAYGVSALAIAALIVPLLNTELPPTAPESQPPLDAMTSSPRLRLGAWLIFLSALVLGAVSALLPLRLEHAGASPEGVGLTFLAASFFAALPARQVGRLTDRYGAVPVSRWGLLLATPVLASLALSLPAGALSVLTVIGIGIALTGIAIPASRLMTEAGEDAGLTPGVTAPLLLFSLALGESVGGPLGATLASSVGDAVPFLALAVLVPFSLAAEMHSEPVQESVERS